MALEDPRGVIRWLLAPENQRHLQVLEALSGGESRAPDLKDTLGIDHPQKVYRSLSYLQDRGLVSEFRDFSGKQTGAIYEVSPIGSRVLEAVHEVQDLIAGPHLGSRDTVVQSARTGAMETTVRLDQGEEVRMEIGSRSQGTDEDTVTVQA